MDHEFTRDLAVVGAGRIGLPWAAVLATHRDLQVTCVDIDENLVARINDGEAPFAEPRLPELLQSAVESGRLRATTNEKAVRDHRYVAMTVNAPRNEMDSFLTTVREYIPHLSQDQVVINRTTLPVHMITRMREAIKNATTSPPSFAVLPERLAEGKAVEEILSLPNIIGTADKKGEKAMRELLEPLDCPMHFTDPETAMFVKLIDNSFRDGLFAIANQIAYVADELDLDGHEAIELANADYPRNDIPSPGLVGGKCLPKDPHFLMDETTCDQPTTPDLFSATRRTNASLPAYIATEVLKKQPKKVTVLGVTYKEGVGDTYNSPAAAIRDRIAAQGIKVSAYDPHVEDVDDDLAGALDGADVVVLATPHAEFVDATSAINEYANPDAEVYDVWGYFNEEQLEVGYDGFGIERETRVATRPTIDESTE